MNKMLLTSLHATVIIAWTQLAFGVVVATCFWMHGFPTPSLSRGDMLALVPASIVFAAGQIATQAALAFGDVSFTHVVKSLEPVVNAFFSALVLGDYLHPLTYLTLVPIVFGVCLTAASWGFNVSTLACGMVSNVCFALRNVLASKYGSIGDLGKDPTTRKTNQLFLLTMLSSAMSLPVVLLNSLFGLQSFLGAWADAVNEVSSLQLCLWLAESSLWFSFYQLSSFWVLSLLQPISHSVLNSMKRVVVIVAAFVFLHEPVTTLGIFGVALATVGAVAYSLAKRMLQNDTPWTWNLKQTGLCIIVTVILGLIMLPTDSIMRVPGAMSAPNMHMARQQEINATQSTMLARTIPLPATMVLVTIPSSAACNGLIHHLSCLKIIIAGTSGVLRWDEEILEPLCRELLAGRVGPLMQGAEILHANVGLCLQVEGRVGAVAKLNDNVSNAAGTFQRSASASDVGQVLRSLPGKPRVVSRKNVYVEGFLTKAAKQMVPSEPEAWTTAMAVDGNLGNLIWEYGATKLINPYSCVWFTSPSTNTAVLPDAMVVATANLLFIPKDNESMPAVIRGMTSYFSHKVRHLNVPSVIIGIGLQADMRDDQDIETTIQALHLHDISVNLLTAFAARAPPAGIAVRGNITSRLCQKAGLVACVPLGCPSFTINRASNLGTILQNQWKRVVQKMNASESSLKLAIHLPQLQRGGRFHEMVYDILIKVYIDYDAIVVLQSTYDRPQLQVRFKKAGIEWNTSRIKFFVDVQAWMHELKQVDFVIGCRIHGTMAAVSAGTASLILPTDFRTLEMAQAMNLPSVFGTELNALQVETFNLPKLIKQVAANLNFDAFERTRRVAIETYRDMLQGMDLEIHPELLQVLGPQ